MLIYTICKNINVYIHIYVYKEIKVKKFVTVFLCLRVLAMINGIVDKSNNKEHISGAVQMFVFSDWLCPSNAMLSQLNYIKRVR